MKIDFDILTRPRVLAFGIDFGNNSLVKGKWKNFFIELSILWWTFGVEINW